MAKKGKNQRASKETREADAFIQSSDKAIKWIQENRTLLIVFIAVFVLFGTGVSVAQWIQQENEIEAQEALFKAENAYFKLKEKRDQAQADFLAASEDKKDQKSEPKKGDDYPSGDFKADYGKEIDALKKVIADHKGSRAAVLAAMTIAQAYRDHEMHDQAEAQLSSVQNDLDGNDILTALVSFQRGLVAEKLGRCDAAVGFWKSIENNRAGAFLLPNALLKQAVCLEKTDKEKAQSLYQRVIDDFDKSAAAKSAQTYLRLLKLNLSQEG